MSNQLEIGRPGGKHYFPDAVVRFDARHGTTQDVSAVLRRGVTIRGRVVGQDGKPVASAMLVSPSYIPRGQEMSGNPLPVRKGRFELPGCDPKQTLRVWVFDGHGQQGACVDLPTDSKEEPTIRLTPCRNALLRVVDRGGKLVARPRAMLDLVLRRGERNVGTGTRPDDITAPVGMLHARPFGIFQGSNGVIAIPWLIPGGCYALRLEERLTWPIKKVFTVPPGPNREVLQLGSVAITPRPPRKP